MNWSDFGDQPVEVDFEELPKFFEQNPDMSGLPLVPVYEALSYTWEIL
jgi:hypothetical protein